MNKIKKVKCEGHFLCERTPFTDGLCKFHLPVDDVNKPNCDDYNALLVQEIKDAVPKKNGIIELHWHGFVFPKNHVLFDHGVFEEVKDRLSKGWFNIEQSDIQTIRIGTYKIHQLIFTQATIHGSTTIPVTEIDCISMRNAIFLGKFHCASKTIRFDAAGAVFEDEFSFGSVVSELANFSACRFHKPSIFHGRSEMVFRIEDSGSKFKIAGFDGAIFGNPTETIFRDVDLRMASFRFVSLVGVRFYNTNFYQNDLKRNGLYNEVKELSRHKKQTRIPFKSAIPKDTTLKRYRHIIHEYRQLRMAMENSKDYAKAHDFYVGEMEVRQRRERNIVLALYRFSSYYGTDYKKAFIVLFFLLAIHIVLTTFLSTHLHWQKLFYGPNVGAAWSRMGDIVIHSLSTGTLQRFGSLDGLSFLQRFIDILFRVIVPSQTAMFVLALRNKIKR